MNTTIRDCPDIGTWRAWLDREDVTAHRFARAADDVPADQGQLRQRLAALGPTRAPDDVPADEGQLRQNVAAHGSTRAAEEHLKDCPACQRLVAELREDADDVHNLISKLAPSQLPTAAEVAVARERLDWRRVRRERPSPPVPVRPLESIPMFLTRLSTPWRVAGGAIAAALALSLLIALTPQGNSVAVAFLAQFRSQEVTAIELTPQTQGDITKSLNALGSLGKVEVPGVSGQVQPAAAARAAEAHARTSVSMAEAASTVGLPRLLTPDPATLPAGVDKTPTVQVMPGSQIKFTFDKKKAQAYLQSSGHANVNLPDKFDGATLVVSMPAAALLEYGSTQANKEGLIIGEAGEVEVSTQGNVSIEEMRDFLLGLPTLPPSVVSQLKSIKNWSNTLPIPVPVGQAQWKQATINGSQGLVLWDNSGVGSAAIWHSNGHLFGVAGTLKATELTRVADSLAVR